MSLETDIPSLAEETRLWQAGYQHVAGIDEAGRGALAGPVVAAAVVLPPTAAYDGVWATVRDSKLLKPKQRTLLAQEVRQSALAWGIGSASPQEIDRIGIAAATRFAMQRAIECLACSTHYLLLDWVRLPAVNVPQESFVKGDRRIVSIAAASILAKTHRDQLLVELSQIHPHYGFERHKGYGTEAHLAALDEYGPCCEHRHSFSPIAQCATLFDDDPERK